MDRSSLGASMKVRYRHLLVAVPIILILAVAGWIALRERKISHLKAENEALKNAKDQYSVEHDYIPQELNKKTTDELSEMGGVIWED
jgi:hypothetical protein